MQVAVLANSPEQHAFRCRHSFIAWRLLCISPQEKEKERLRPLASIYWEAKFYTWLPRCSSPFADVQCAMQVAVLVNIPEQQATWLQCMKVAVHFTICWCPMCAMQVAVLANIPEQQAFWCRHSFNTWRLLRISSLAEVLCAMYLRRMYLMPAG